MQTLLKSRTHARARIRLISTIAFFLLGISESTEIQLFVRTSGDIATFDENTSPGDSSSQCFRHHDTRGILALVPDASFGFCRTACDHWGGLCLDFSGLRIVVLVAMLTGGRVDKASTTATKLRTFVLVSWFCLVFSRVNCKRDGRDRAWAWYQPRA